jgi:hypothetical protein
MTGETCTSCTDEQTPDPGPVAFAVQPQIPAHVDVTFTCARHLPTIVTHYSRRGFASLVRAIGLEKDA